MADHMAAEDGAEFADPSSQAAVQLTQEQRQRIAQQKELALARRSANEQKRGRQSSGAASPACPLPVAALETGWISTKNREALPVWHGDLTGKREDIVKVGAAMAAGFPCEKRTEIVDVDERPDDELPSSASVLQHCEALSVQSRGSIRKREEIVKVGDAMMAGHSCEKRTDIIVVDEKPDDESPSSASVLQQSNFAAFAFGAKLMDKQIDSDHSSDSRLGEWRSIRKRLAVEGNIQAVAQKMKPQTCMLQQDAVESQSHSLPIQTQMKMDELGTSTTKTNDVEKKPGKIVLSLHQMNVLKAIIHGKSVFITGSAGTGKSFLLEFAVRLLKKVHGPESIFVTASTGLAACALSGTTIHSFAGIGLGLESKVVLAEKVKSKRDVRKRWMNAKALIIDEISMIDGELFDKLEYVASHVRRPLGKTKVFGGLQLIVTGDFFQLPPVSPENTEKYFAFQADCWNKCFELQIEFTRVFRQSDSEFVAMLNELRKGYCSITTLERLQQCWRPVKDSDTGIILTKLYPRKTDVGRENDQNLNALNNDKVTFIAKDVGKSEFAMRQLENVRAEKVLDLCVGAQVMLVKNLETSIGLVNGARGVVLKFIPVDDPSASEYKHFANSVSPHGVWPVVRFACDKTERLIGPESWSIMEGDREIAKRSQIPLILAWALSVHKCQGMTLDRVETDLSRAFDYGMVYVALSRVKSLEGLHLIGFDPSRIKVHPRVVQFYDGLKTDDSFQPEISSVHSTVTAKRS